MTATTYLDIERAMWAGDTDTLHQIAACKCCCDEHTFESCPARSWHGCRGQHSLTYAEIEAWEDHYRVHHGLSSDEFHAYGAPP